MKIVLIGILAALFSISAFAEVNQCLDEVTGKSTGVLRDLGNGKVGYSYDRNSNEQWILKLTQDGKLYNADDMVRGGQRFFVGSIEYVNFRLHVVINNRKMICI